jgi:phage terminase small subunit
MERMNQLTSKQHAFANAVISGLNYSDAYRSAYDCKNSNPATVARRANELLNNSQIAALIAEGKSAITDKVVWSRTMALERLLAVNNAAYIELTKKGVRSRETNSAFFNSLDRLNELFNVNTRNDTSVLVTYIDNQGNRRDSISNDLVVIHDDIPEVFK